MYQISTYVISTIIIAEIPKKKREIRYILYLKFIIYINKD